MMSATLTSPSLTSLHGNGSSSHIFQATKPVNALRRSLSTGSTPSKNNPAQTPSVNGLAHVSYRLEAKYYKTSAFRTTLLEILRTLIPPTWDKHVLSVEELKLVKVSGSLTNAVFFVSYPEIPSLRTLLIRVYGPSSGQLISRVRELHILHVLSSQYRIGPRLYGTFDNGRVEEYFPSDTLTAQDIRDPLMSRWIGARMAELHCVDVGLVEGPFVKEVGEGDIAACRNIRTWLPHARAVLALLDESHLTRRLFDLQRFEQDWKSYMAWVEAWEAHHGASERVFAHNDAQYGNLLKLKEKRKGLPEHRQIIVVDFEYAALNPAAFDIANHFHEWTANYHSDTPYILNPLRFPTLNERINFYRSYIKHCNSTIASQNAGHSGSVDLDVQRLEAQVQAWRPAAHGMWAIWGIVQAREYVEALAHGEVSEENMEFDYIGYACCRMDLFTEDIKRLGIIDVQTLN